MFTRYAVSGCADLWPWFGETRFHGNSLNGTSEKLDYEAGAYGQTCLQYFFMQLPLNFNFSTLTAGKKF